MSEIQLTSPRGVEVKPAVYKGVTYHRPPWISKRDFIAGLRSKEHDEPLSSLVGCELIEWEDDEDYDGNPIDTALFKLTFKVPFNSVREIVGGRFTPAGGFGDNKPYETTVVEDGVLVELTGREYRDFNDVQVYVFPKSILTEKPSYSGNAEWLEEGYEDLLNDFEGTVEYAEGWEGLYEEFTSDGVDQFILVKAHED